MRICYRGIAIRGLAGIFLGTNGDRTQHIITSLTMIN